MFEGILSKLSKLNAPLPPGMGMVKELIAPTSDQMLPVRMFNRTPPGYIFDSLKRLISEDEPKSRRRNKGQENGILATLAQRISEMNAPLPPAMGMAKELIAPSSDANLLFRLYGRTPMGYVSGAVGDLMGLPSKGVPLPGRILESLGVPTPCSGGTCGSSTTGGLSSLEGLDNLSAPKPRYRNPYLPQ
jgi:hypothetical protein